MINSKVITTVDLNKKITINREEALEIFDELSSLNISTVLKPNDLENNQTNSCFQKIKSFKKIKLLKFFHFRTNIPQT